MSSAKKEHHGRESKPADDARIWVWFHVDVLNCLCFEKKIDLKKVGRKGYSWLNSPRFGKTRHATIQDDSVARPEAASIAGSLSVKL